MNTDPIAQIQKAEEQAEKKIANKQKELDEKLLHYQEELDKKLVEFEGGLKETGTAKLENVKKDAGEIVKTKMATLGAEKNKIIGEAKEKENDAVKEVVNSFFEYSRP